MQRVRKFQFDVYGALGTGVFRIGLNLEGDKTRGLSSRRMTETYDGRKEWRNKGREMQFGIGYSIPWDVGRSGHSRYVHAMHHIDEWGHVHMVLVECPSGVASEAPCRSWTEKGSLGHNHMHKWWWGWCGMEDLLGWGASTTLVSKCSLEYQLWMPHCRLLRGKGFANWSTWHLDWVLKESVNKKQSKTQARGGQGGICEPIYNLSTVTHGQTSYLK